jgi:hypothetical protein
MRSMKDYTPTTVTGRPRPVMPAEASDFRMKVFKALLVITILGTVLSLVT